MIKKQQAMRVTEQDIDQILNMFENGGEMIDEMIEHTLNRYPPVSYYLTQVDQDILTGMEYDQLLVGAAVILEAFRNSGEVDLTDDVLDLLSEQEDLNWKKILAQNGKFHQKLDAFFEGYPEEDLLAFIEDSLVDEGEGSLSPVGQEVIFIKLKTLTDVLFDLQSPSGR